MVSDLARVNVFIVSVLLFGAGSGWALSELAGPVDPVETDPLFPDEPEILVLYPTHVVRVRTEPVAFDNDGRAVFSPVPVETVNITKVSMSLHIQMEGAAPYDRFDIRATAPDATHRDAQTTAPPSLAGYKVSQTVVQEWPRKAAPGPTTYTTHEPETALRWSAENHTDTRSTGQWAVTVKVTPPGTNMAPRNGQAYIEFTFVAYEAVAFPNWEPSDLETLGGNNTTAEEHAGDDHNTTTAAMPTAPPRAVETRKG